MNQTKQTKRTATPLIKKLMQETTAVNKSKNKARVALACRIDDLIKAKQYTYVAFALKVAKQPSEISKWISGTHNFTMDTLTEIAFALNIELHELFEPTKPNVIFSSVVHLVAIDTTANPYAPHAHKSKPMGIPINIITQNQYA